MADVPEADRAIIYVRQSQDRGGNELGVTRQRDACTQLCDQRGWSVTETITDNDVSATSRRPRPGYNRLLKMMENGEADIIVVYHVDRLTRKMRDLEDVIDLCEKTGVRVVTASGDLDMSTDAGRLNGRILASVARAEVERKAARQRLANAQAAAAGRRVGGRRPFGYRQNGKTVVAREAAALREAYDAVLAGASLAAIAREWNSQGLHSGQGSWKEKTRGQPTLWTHTTVRRVLLNPRYMGVRAHNGEVAGPAEWPAIVSEDKWQAVTALLGDPSRAHRPKGGRRLLTNLATCGVCGEFVHAGGASHGKPVYRCRSMRHINRLAEPADEYVGMVVVARLSRPDAVDLLVDDTRPDVAGLRQDAHALRVRLDGLGTQFADGVLTASQLRTITIRLRERIADLESQMADAGKVDVLGPLVSTDDVESAWAGLGVDRQRVVVDALMAVRLLPVGRGYRDFRPGTVEITWRTGDE